MLSKCSKTELSDNVYNWLVDFFCERTHCTRYNDKNSQSLNITASVIQGSAIGPASFVIAASDLQPITDGNCSEPCCSAFVALGYWPTLMLHLMRGYWPLTIMCSAEHRCSAESQPVFREFNSNFNNY